MLACAMALWNSLENNNESEEKYAIYEQAQAKLDRLLAEERLRELAETSMRVSLQRQNAQYFAMHPDTSIEDGLKALYAVNKPEDDL